MTDRFFVAHKSVSLVKWLQRSDVECLLVLPRKLQVSHKTIQLNSGSGAEYGARQETGQGKSGDS